MGGGENELPVTTIFRQKRNRGCRRVFRRHLTLIRDTNPIIVPLVPGMPLIFGPTITVA